MWLRRIIPIRTNVVLARSRFLKTAHLLQRNPKSFDLESETDFECPNLEEDGSRWNRHWLNSLEAMPQESKKFLNAQQKLQQFVGERFPLLPQDMLVILCGGANLAIERRMPAGPAQTKVWTRQAAVRQLGRSFFASLFHLATLFSDNTFLSMSKEDMQSAMLSLPSHNVLACLFMKANHLYAGVVPFRGVHKPEAVAKNKAEQIRAVFKDRSAADSFFTMLGVMLLHFDHKELDEHFFSPKVFEGDRGIFALAASHQHP